MRNKTLVWTRILILTEHDFQVRDQNFWDFLGNFRLRLNSRECVLVAMSNQCNHCTLFAVNEFIVSNMQKLFSPSKHWKSSHNQKINLQHKKIIIKLCSHSWCESETKCIAYMFFAVVLIALNERMKIMTKQIKLNTNCENCKNKSDFFGNVRFIQFHPSNRSLDEQINYITHAHVSVSDVMIYSVQRSLHCWLYV